MIFENIKSHDYIKILELSNFIDNWEQTVLFSQNGFYTLKGKDVQGKTKELLEVLEKDIDKIESEEEFENSISYQKAEEIKKSKIQTIKEKMLSYEKSECLKWEVETTEKAIEASKEKAISYKNYPETIEKCYLNGLSAIGLKSELIQSSKEETNAIIKQFNSDFFEGITKSFIDENSEDAQKFYTQNKNYIFKEKRENLEKSIEQLNEKQQSFKQAKELIFQDINKTQAFEKISKIKNERIKKYTKVYFEGFYNSKENLNREEKERKTKERWENIDSSLTQNSDIALSFVDLNGSEEEINAQINYIKAMIKDGEIKTDNKKFFELYKLAFEESEKFTETNLYNFKPCLSKEDFEYLQKLKENMPEIKSDYFELKQHFEKSDDYNTLLIKTVNLEKKICEKNTNKQISLSQAAELIESVAARIKKWDLIRKRG